jgi:allantoicase
VDTSYFTGNYPERCSIEGCAAPAEALPEELEGPGTQWTSLLPESPLRGDVANYFAVHAVKRVTHLRFRIFPDGGVARLRAYGIVLPDWAAILPGSRELDLAGIAHGTHVVDSSDRHYGNPNHLLLPGRGLHMGDGWETRRRRGPGHDWCILKLGVPGKIRKVEVDTLHYKGNFPESCSLEGCTAGEVADDAVASAALPWQPVLPRLPLRADSQHAFQAEVLPAGEVTHVRFNIYPDGGVGRLRLIGEPSPPRKA